MLLVRAKPFPARRKETARSAGEDASGRWRNWAGDQICRPAAIERPRNPDDVTALLEKAELNDLTVRVAGAGHSFGDAVLTDGLLLSLDGMDRTLDYDEASGLIRVQAGIRLRALNERLASLGRALENLGDIDEQSVAGATATGTHGTGLRLPNLSAGIHSLEVVGADGMVTELDEDSDPVAWRAGRISLGALGVVTAVTLRTVPAFTLRGVDATRPLEEVFENLDDLVESNEHFEFYNFPHSPLALTRTNNKVETPPKPRPRPVAWMNEVFLTNHLYGAVCRLGRRVPAAIPTLNRVSSRLAGSTTRVDQSHRIFASPRLVRFTEMEYGIPRTHAVAAVRAVRDVVARSGFHVPFPMEVRFVAPDDALLSPTAGRETCYIAVHMFERMEWEAYFRAVEEIMDGFDGRPHWGKRHFQSAQTLRPRYPQWDAFQEVRARLDPHGRFANAHVERVLGRAPAS